MIDLNKIEASTMECLKDFQAATVNRVDYLYRSGQNRVLVADEVGLGKTLVAKGVIIKTANLRAEEGDNLFKVVYICSNQNIANQNINKLKVSDEISIDGVSETRLSMQHLKIFEQENDLKILSNFIQLIPLTPDTSFHITSGNGSVYERALMYVILSKMEEFKPYDKELEELLAANAYKSWNDWVKKFYVDRVDKCNKSSKGKYPAIVIKEIYKYFKKVNLKNTMLNYLISKKQGTEAEITSRGIISKLRIMFAEISVGFLQPDLVIMDEFQRFKFIISADEESDTGILVKKFLSSKDLRILLLSATPYKLYSTLDEINEEQIDEHYSEFFTLMNFMFNNDEKRDKFKEIWSNYSIKLRELSEGDTSIIQIKNQAEDAMYESVCRTERISVVDSGDFIDDSSVKKQLAICENDVLSYIQAEAVLNDINANFSVPVDYIKSSPYILSFMRNYKLKLQVEKYFKNHQDEINKAKKKLLWLDSSKLNGYNELPKTNAKLECLKDNAFINKSELYLWVPPSKPYYNMQGVYKNSEGFSKILVFSAWEMVPRMIGSLISYEAERLTVGKLSAQAKNEDKKNAEYFANNSKRYPAARLRFNINNNEARGMSLFCLLYPSKYLASCYDPIECMNQLLSLKEIESLIKNKIMDRMDTLKKYQGISNRIDEKWYYLAPMLLDDDEYVNGWLQDMGDIGNTRDDEVNDEDRGNKGFKLHIARLKELLSDTILQLGKMPEDLVQTLVNMAVASPSICIYRSNGNNSKRAAALAKIFINRFNTQESTAIIDLCYGRSKDDISHWQNVLSYCKDGNFQAMLDEYIHILNDTVNLTQAKDKDELLYITMKEALQFHTANYSVDTFNVFKARIEGKKSKPINMRAHYAVGFTNGEGDESKQVNRKESIRNAFNSPLRPFVLATTSIGQEGLDFHNYCRKIMHWNLPSNPVDLEQREGRINRFKCLAIRQNVAKKYGNIHCKSDVWKEMFQEALDKEKKHDDSELIPFWCIGNNQEVKIERIVSTYPMSKDISKYEHLIKILSLYRLTMGQARQEELLEYIFKNFEDSKDLKNLFINLSPYSKKIDVRENKIKLSNDTIFIEKVI